MSFFDEKKNNQPTVPTPEIQLNGDQGRIRDKNGEEREVKIPKLTWA